MLSHSSSQFSQLYLFTINNMGQIKLVKFLDELPLNRLLRQGILLVGGRKVQMICRTRPVAHVVGSTSKPSERVKWSEKGRVNILPTSQKYTIASTGGV